MNADWFRRRKLRRIRGNSPDRILCGNRRFCYFCPTTFQVFRHRGKSRTLIHNLKLASLLSFVAGIVNVTGLFAIQTLTTNVTGHFAYFADELSRNHVATALSFLLYILAFFAGAFLSNLLVEIMDRRSQRFVNSPPDRVWRSRRP